MLQKKNLRIILAIALIFYPYVVLVILKSEGFEITPLSAIISFALTFLTVFILWISGKSMQSLSRKIWKQEKEEELPEPRNLKEVVKKILSEMTDLPLIGEAISGMIVLFPLGIILVLNEKFELFQYSTSMEIILYGLIILIWVEIMEKEFQIRMCTPYFPVPIKYVCYVIVGINVLVSGIQWFGLYDFG